MVGSIGVNRAVYGGVTVRTEPFKTGKQKHILSITLCTLAKWTRPVPQVEQDLLTLPEHQSYPLFLSGIRGLEL